jgi:alcohol dehydrogenase (NADP+)
MEQLKQSGKVKNIGISNFSKKETERLLSHATIKPAVIQMEIHPHLAQVDYIKWLQGQGILFIFSARRTCGRLQ